jgi:hypothetical protein
MDLLGMLRKLGDRLGIVEVSPGPQAPSSPVKIQTRAVTLTELIMTIQVSEVRELAESPAEMTIPFDEVYKAAGIEPPAAGWTVDRLMEFLKSDRIQTMSREDAQREAISMLAADKVDAAEVVKDAISRDQALDAFADSIAEKRQRWVMEQKDAIQAIERELADEENKWTEWRRRKRKREQDMANAVGYLIGRQVISIDEE